MTQAQLAARAEISQQEASRAEAGNVQISLDVRCRLASAAGHELGWRLHPVMGVALRDSGQMGLATAIVESSHTLWVPQLEAPIAAGDPRAADILFAHPRETAHVEIERALFDFQAQLRAAQRKRQVLAERETRPVRLILAVPDTRATRQKLSPVLPAVVAALPIPSRRIWASLRAGEPIGGDGLLFVRVDRAIPRRYSDE